MRTFSDTSITFPGLGIEVDPSFGFSIGSFNIRWYAVVIACGLLLAVIYASRRSRSFGVTSDDVLDIVLVGLPAAIVGARLYYVIFQWDEFFGPGIPWYHCFEIWKGGLAIYGGVIAAVLSVGIFCLVKKERRAKFLPFLDLAGLGFPIGQAIGRWGNFFNREAHGCEVGGDFLLRMGLYENGNLIYVHPTFLYESVWNAVGFVLLHFLSKKRRFDGQMFLCYVIWYGLGRAWIEGLRTDSLYVGATGIRVSQLLAGASCLIGVGLLLYILLAKRPDPANLLVNRAAEKTAEQKED